MASSLEGSSYGDVYAPHPINAPTLLDSFQQGESIVNGIISQQRQTALFQQQQADYARQQGLNAALDPLEVKKAQYQVDAMAPLTPAVNPALGGGIGGTYQGIGSTITPPSADASSGSGSVGAVSNASAPDADGFHLTTGTTFAGPKDIANFAKTGSLATGDNGKGAWGDDTTDIPQVALPPSTLKAYGIDPDKAHGTPVTLRANGKQIQAIVTDKLPDYSKNGSGIDLNPGSAKALGIADLDNFKGQVQFKIGGGTPVPAPNLPTIAPSNMGIASMDQGIASPNFAALPGVAGANQILAGPLAPVGNGMGIANMDRGIASAPIVRPQTATMQQQRGYYAGPDNFVVSDDPRVRTFRTIPLVSPVLARNDQSMLGQAGKLGLQPSNYDINPDDPNFSLTPAARAKLRSDIAAASAQAPIVNLLRDADQHGVDASKFYDSSTGTYDRMGLQSAIAGGSQQQRREGQKFTQAALASKAALDSMEAYAALPPEQRTAAGDVQFVNNQAIVDNPGVVPTESVRKDFYTSRTPIDDLKVNMSGLFGGPKRKVTDQQIAEALPSARSSVLQRMDQLKTLNQGGAPAVAALPIGPGGIAGIGMPQGIAAMPVAAPVAAGVKMRSPSGKIGTIPADKAAAAQAAGFTVVQ